MKIIKKILFTVLALIAIALIAAAFMPKDYAVERKITINKPIDSVFTYLTFLKNQDKFSVWNKMDTISPSKTTGIDGTVGTTYSWDSPMKDVGAGTQEITKIIPNDRIDIGLTFTRPFENKSTSYFKTIKNSDGSTEVVWAFQGNMPYPMNAMLPVLKMDEMMGKDMQKSLDDLKVILEKK